jgi:hypothetical protein
MMNKEVGESCLGWEGIDNWMPVTPFMTKIWRVSVIVACISVEPTNGNSSESDEFYFQLQD